MAETAKEAYLALIAARDPEIRALLDQGFEFVTNAFKVDAAPSGMKARTDQEHVWRLQQAFPVKTRNFVRWRYPRELDETSTLINPCF